MNDHDNRRELKAAYRETRPDAGVYRIVNTRTGKVLLATTPNLASLRNRIEFAKSTGSVGALDGRLAADVREFGIEAFALDVLEVVPAPATKTRDEIASDLALLEELWREKLADQPLY